MNKYRVFIVDDDQKICEALEWLLESVNLRVETFCTASDFLVYCKNNELERSCAIVDVRMPGMSGLELLDQLTIHKKSLPVILLTGHGDIPMAVRAMKSGAVDFISKPFNDQYLLDQIYHALSLNQSTTNKSDNNIAIMIEKLTRRELEVMKLVIAGRLNKQIASDLGLSTSTIELHRSRVMAKMETKILADLIKSCMLYQMENPNVW